jgi:predicted nucleotidyltransferase component of viral defense system
VTNKPAAPQIQSIKSKLLNLAKAQGVIFPHLMTHFLLERAAYRLLLDETLARHLIFKGGFVSVKVYNSPRHTTDLDALAHGGLGREVIESRIKAAMAADIDDGCWFEFEKMANLQMNRDVGGARYVFRAGLGERPRRLELAQLVNLDIGLGAEITRAPRPVTTPLTLGNGQLSWHVYAVETVLAEKLHALVTLGSRNSRAKDVFDIQLFLPQASKAALHEALRATFAYRGDALPVSISDVVRRLDTENLRRAWTPAVSSIKLPPTFDNAFQAVLEYLVRLDL